MAIAINTELLRDAATADEALAPSHRCGRIDVFSADLVPGSRLAELYAPIITGRPALSSFQTAAELHYGALRRGWGAARMLKREIAIGQG